MLHPLDFRDYKDFFRKKLAESEGRGSTSRLAEALGCQPGFVSQVLRGNAHFSQEQVLAAARHWGLDATASRALVRLLLKNRAGSSELARLFEAELEELRQARDELKTRLRTQALDREALAARYYASWQPSAVHMAATLPGPQSLERIAERLGVEAREIRDAVELLLEAGLLKESRRGLETTKAQLHVGNDSPFLANHHRNWRLRALKDIEAPRANSLHYSSVISLAHEDLPRVRERMIRAIEDIRAMVRASPSETLAAYGLDFFEF